MTSFYKKAIEHQELGPYFINELGNDITDDEWVDHIELLADFWLAKLLGEETYYGDFVGAHVKMPHIKKETVSIWLDLFSLTLDEIYVQDVAEDFRKKGAQLTMQFLNRKKKI